MKYRHTIRLLLMTIATLGLTPAMAAIDSTGPIPLTSEEAFDAVATGCVGGTCYGVGKVVLVDVRTQSELDFQGGPAKANEIVLKNGTSIIPDMGKVMLSKDGKFLKYAVNGKKKTLKVDKVQEVITELIGKLAACSIYDPVLSTFVPDTVGFSAAMTAIADDMDKEYGEGLNVAITMCNSGGRSTQCPLAFITDEAQERFHAWYEIDKAGEMYITPDAFDNPPFPELGAPPGGIHMAVLGGYSGSDYGGDYNGIIGFPGRQTQNQPETGWVVPDPDSFLDFRFAAPSGETVSWKDSGLPIFIPAVQCIL